MTSAIFNPGLAPFRNLSDVSSVATSKTNLSLNNVDNTSDVNKPVSTAQQTALNLKADLSGPTFTGNITVTNAAPALSLTEVGASNTTTQIVLDGDETSIRPNSSYANAFKLNTAGFATFAAGASFGATPTVSGDTVMTRGANETVGGIKTFTDNVWSDVVAASDKGIRFNVGGNLRWLLVGSAGAESGSNSGSLFRIYRYNDASGFLGTALSIDRATGNADFHGLQVSGKQALSHAGAYTSGQVTLSTSAPSGGSDGDIWFQYV